ncbi:peptidoglycan editing factor PgeF [Pseudoxanthomonas gei]|uniref:Purine nucleoside phosphorylase n=1 Tax=Pseudoxanthomonas gei TaxID=1383030 RepID=A0ABX0ABU4_9GAMM|nr:peptidoglycan editing factor PgeF [Pseudoxanthomonas gei]NDK38092.1 peptidoglycan editing factor PgeF [Pseudoxanthomonas gei]
MTPAVWAQWPVPANVRAFTSVRHGAGSSLPPFDSFNLGNRAAAGCDDPQVVDRNRAELVERFDLPSTPRWLRQVHGTEVVRFDRAAMAQHEEPLADACVTADPGVVLAILTADCLPVVLAAEDGSEIGAAHAGWRGLADGVLETTVAAMQTPAGRLLAWLGPAAGPRTYEIGEEVFDAFVSQDAGAEAAFAPTRRGHWRVDLYALARQRLMRLGLTRIHGGDLCTISDPGRFYSHRRDARTGRMATVVWMQS